MQLVPLQLVHSRPQQLEHRLFTGLQAVIDVIFGLPIVVVWWLLFRWSPDPP